MWKNYIIILLIFVLFFSSCIKKAEPIVDTNFSDLSDNQKEILIRVMAAAYNAGENRDFKDILNNYVYSTSYTYDENIWGNYKYFTGLSNIMPTKNLTLKDIDSEDKRIEIYVGNIMNNYINNSNSVKLIDAFDEKIPVNPQKTDRDFSNLNPELLSSYEKRDFLVERVYNLISRDYNDKYLFRTWYDKYFSEELTNEEIRKYAEYIVDVAYTYTHSNIILENKTSYDPPKVYLNHIPVELALAIIYQESKFFPGTFRAEIRDNKIYAISFGLSHILIDADFLYIASSNDDIGDGIIKQYKFNQISSYYLGNNLNEETYFSDWDLITIRGSILYELIFLDSLYQKFIVDVKEAIK
ncbi:hypothetical protein XO10_03430 [Marinitoga sp. 1135]|uniref:hypothetical protein n=1 Tax=unclassified Marinitoga TaxID=2640159 RepID=UPI0009503625|nr:MULTISPECIES: hypothetical protein [unclassified Marinitoga]APT75616.1 hypothetical protein LN42_03830 [Marinitoga sp. 1137]NUU95326.1 hypothetical protein [Marinitoga sp. 1135]NUU97260.1 hypothetical protein [Marinitoga sp. 1138]